MIKISKAEYTMSKKVIIIGAGLAGLSAGIYLQREGITTEIFELSPRAGGMCAAWYRNGYRFDACIHWMVGTRKGDPIHHLYSEVGALVDDTVIYNTGTVSLENKGARYDIPLEPGLFKAFLLSLSREDAACIQAFCKDIDMMGRSRPVLGPPANIKALCELLKNSRGFLCTAHKYRGKTVAEVVNGFKSDIIRDILLMQMPGHYSAAALFLMLGTRLYGNAGYPLGGASVVAGGVEEKYRSLGGKINFNSRIDDILIAGGRACGVRQGGAAISSNGVIAACDAWYTLKKMLRSQYSHPQLDSLLSSGPLFDPAAIISFGLDRKLGIPFSAVCECPEGVATAPDTLSHSFHLRSFDFDPSAAPQQGSSVMVMFSAPLDYWMRLRYENRNAYNIRKEHLAETIADRLDTRYPGFKDAITVVDVATPATFMRMANVYKGSFEGFAPTPSALKLKIKKTVPGLKAFRLCGQWTSAGGGLCTAIADGKEAAMAIKKEIR
jgi:phytoene dehydrogenase-like protein